MGYRTDEYLTPMPDRSSNSFDGGRNFRSSYSTLKTTVEGLVHQLIPPGDDRVVVEREARRRDGLRNRRRYYFELFLPHLDGMVLSRVPGEYEGDTSYPEWVTDEWTLADETPYGTFTVEEWVRRPEV